MGEDNAEVLLSDYEREASHAIDEGRYHLAYGIQEVLAGARRIENALNKLQTYCDIEYTEGTLGKDMRQHLEAVQLHVRAMEARQVQD